MANSQNNKIRKQKPLTAHMTNNELCSTMCKWVNDWVTYDSADTNPRGGQSVNKFVTLTEIYNYNFTNLNSVMAFGIYWCAWLPTKSGYDPYQRQLIEKLS